MHLTLLFDTTHPKAGAAFDAINLELYNRFWAGSKYDDDAFKVPCVVEVDGMERVVGSAYCTQVPPPLVFEGLPYLQLFASELRVRRLTHVPEAQVSALYDAIEAIHRRYPGVVKEEECEEQ